MADLGVLSTYTQGGSVLGTNVSNASSSGGFGAGGAMAALAVADAVVAIAEGRAIKKQSEINARIFEQQAAFSQVLIGLSDERFDISRDIELTRMRRAKNRMASQVMANLGASGLDFSGSPVEVMLDNLTQAGIDEEIVKYNTEIQKIDAAYNLKTEQIGYLSKASQTRYEGKLARNTAYSKAFSTSLKGYARYKAYKEGYGKEDLFALR